MLMDGLRRLFGIQAPEPLDPAVLDEIHARDFPETDKARLGRLWTEVARIVRVSPNRLRAHDELRALARQGSRFPYMIMEGLSDLMLDESNTAPEEKLNTVGDFLGWLLRESRRTPAEHEPAGKEEHPR